MAGGKVRIIGRSGLFLVQGGGCILFRHWRPAIFFYASLTHIWFFSDTEGWWLFSMSHCPTFLIGHINHQSKLPTNWLCRVCKNSHISGRLLAKNMWVQRSERNIWQVGWVEGSHELEGWMGSFPQPTSQIFLSGLCTNIVLGFISYLSLFSDSYSGFHI